MNAGSSTPDARPLAPDAAGQASGSASVPLGGGCACGNVRYALASPPFDPGYCHCRICQLTSGAPVLAFATVPLGDFLLLRGELTQRRSTPFGERGFCRECGTPLTMQVDHQPGTIDFTIATLDDPSSIAPNFHIWYRSRINWFDTDDTFSRHDRFRPDTAGLSGDSAKGRQG